VPSVEEIKGRIAAMLKQVKPDLLFINPVSTTTIPLCSLNVVFGIADLTRFGGYVTQDCGLKTRGWKETEASLVNVVEATKWARDTYKA
jgi:5-methyltetrahydropteroyltriglutamate--homocysteine methyltransferase